MHLINENFMLLCLDSMCRLTSIEHLIIYSHARRVKIMLSICKSVLGEDFILCCFLGSSMKVVCHYLPHNVVAAVVVSCLCSL